MFEFGFQNCKMKRKVSLCCTKKLTKKGFQSVNQVPETKKTHLTMLSGKHKLRLRVMELDIEKSNGTNTCKGLIQA